MAARRVERRRGSLLILNPIPGVACAGLRKRPMVAADVAVLFGAETCNFCDLEHNDSHKAAAPVASVNTLSFATSNSYHSPEMKQHCTLPLIGAEKFAVVSDSEEEEESIGDENLSSVAIEIPAEVWAMVLDCEFI